MTPPSIRWMTEGHEYFRSCLAKVSDAEIEGPSRLPGWSGKHVLSHVGHNARALGRLVTWARTDQPTPMYANAGARAEEIESGAAWSVPRLRAFVGEEQENLTEALAHLTDTMWQTEVVTAQGRRVPATTIPWLRSREVWIHACDLPSSSGDFADFPPDFLDALVEDVLTRRAAQGIERLPVDGPIAELARWLTGRGKSPLVRTSTGGSLPALPPWL